MQRTPRTIGVVSRPLALPVIAAFAAGICGLSTSASATVVTDATNPTIAAETYGNPSSGGFSSSYENGNYGSSLDNPLAMFSNGTVANIGATFTGSNYADSGYYPTNDVTSPTNTASMNDLSPVVSVDYGSANAGFVANAIVFGQRSNTAGNMVSQINVWFLSAPYTETFTPGANSPYVVGATGNGTDPGTDSVPTSNIIGSESIAITDQANEKETEYLFPDQASYASRYVVVQFVDTATLNATTGNTPGGYAFNLANDSAVPEPAALGLVGFAISAASLRRRRRAGTC